ncbi:MAG: helix-turn-helix domain-containing protein [Algiphilus sp.]|uniref:MmyB family transcriptional regulator n=1 Tax=Algiphilus sp. TaxID=1872431 RepID=UPI0032ED989F
MESPLSERLRSLRRRTGLSQLALATQAGTTQRHISFIECGRSTPGRALLARLADALSLSMEARNQLFCAAGYLPPVPAALSAPKYEPLRQAAWHLMEQHGFYPALLLDGHCNILGTNTAFERLLLQVDPEARLWTKTCPLQPNLLHLTFHPEGLVRHMVDAEAWLPMVWHHAIQQLPDDEETAALLRALAAYPAVQAIQHDPVQAGAEAMVVERYRVGMQTYSLLSMVVRVGTPRDRTAAALQLSLLFPADQATDDFLLQLERGTHSEEAALVQVVGDRRAANAARR